MKISALRIQNFKKLSELDIHTDRAVVILGGKNRAGKSSALDAIEAALCGAGAVPDEPVRRGQVRGVVELDLGSVTVRRTFTRKEDGTYGGGLKITTKDGMSPSGAQGWLDQRFGDLTCDPIAFLRDKPEVQAERLRKLAKIDTSEMDTQRATLYAERTDIGRDGVREGAVLKSMVSYPEAPAKEVEPEVVVAEETLVSEVLAELEAATTTEIAAANAERIAADRGAHHGRTESVLAARQARTEELRALLAAAERDAVLAAEVSAAANVAATEAEAEAKTVRAAAIDSAPIRRRLAGLEDANRKAREDAAAANRSARQAADLVNLQVRVQRIYVAQEVKVKALQADYAAKTAAIHGTDKARTELLAAAKFPVEGLALTDGGGVTFGGIPLSQASGAEKIRVSMAVALASNPEIRVVLIRDASLLDDDSLALVISLAEEADAQVWLERVGDKDEGAVVIVDGTVAADVG